MGWTICVTKQVLDWVDSLDEETFDHYEAARQELEERGPTLGRPWVDTLKGSRHSNRKELRIPGSNARVLFAFDPKRAAIFLIAGDKTNKWTKWYRDRRPHLRRTYRRVGLMDLYKSDQTRHPRGGYDQSRVDAVRREMRAVERAYRLAELREDRHLNQTELGKQIGVGQRTVSKIEHGGIEHSKIETIRKYIEGLGGEIEVVARFGDQAYIIA